MSDHNAEFENANKLHRAAEGNRLAEVQSLLDNGADVNAHDSDEKTALHSARSAEMAGLLIERKASMEALTNTGYKPLHSAARTDNTTLVKAIIDHGAEVHVANHNFALTPLHMAVDDRYVDVVELLMDCGADVNATDWIGMTPLCHGRYQELAQILTQRGGTGALQPPPTVTSYRSAPNEPRSRRVAGRPNTARIIQ